jgi:hypothetical protein
MNRRIGELSSFAALALLALSIIWPSSAGAQPQREWTVMVYMNAKNNLEPYALGNFHGMAEVGGTPQVAVVAQLGRPSSERYTSEDGNWSGVYRFNVAKNTQPLPAQAAVDVQAVGESTDMGSPTALRQFISWAKKTYPAKRYMLVIWNHGQGWRLMLAANKQHRMLAAANRMTSAHIQSVPRDTPAVGGYRAVSSDDDTGSILFNRDVQQVISQAFADRKLDVLGYDACLMAMIETAYGLTSSVDVMVGSEELEPGEGWRYSAWLAKLVASPVISNENLGAEVVNAYQAQYGNSLLTTLSSLKLDKVPVAAVKLSVFSKSLLAAGEPQLELMRISRAALESYGASVRPPLRTSVDIAALLKGYEAATTNAELKAQSVEVRNALHAAVLANYASTRSQYPQGLAPYGSEGLAIYYPDSEEAFLNDPYHKGYFKSNTDRPIDFVMRESWADLLYKLLKTSGQP